jgi:hypothetical protein
MSGNKNIDAATETTYSQKSRSILRPSDMHSFLHDHDADFLMLPMTRHVVPSTRACVSAVRARGA